MKKIYSMILILTVLIGISAVSAAENMTGDGGILKLDNADEVCDIGTCDGVPVEKAVESNPLKADDSSSIQNEVQIPSKATAKNIKSTYGTKVKYSLKVFDKSGKTIAGEQVKFKIGKKVYNVKTDSNGVATLKLNYASGKYVIKYSVGYI